MKKKEDNNSISNVLFKVLVGITVLIFVLIILTQPKDNFSFKENKLRNNSSTKNFGAPNRKPAENVPSELQWFDVFKGIGNEK